jgi:hypothetical protein
MSRTSHYLVKNPTTPVWSFDTSQFLWPFNYLQNIETSNSEASPKKFEF